MVARRSRKRLLIDHMYSGSCQPRPEPVDRHAPCAPPGRCEMPDPRRALVVEDNAHIGAFLTTLLEEMGFVVTGCVDGSDALHKLEEGPCDLVITDLEMSPMNGFELLDALRGNARLSSIPAIAVPGRDAAELAEARRRGAIAAVAKPFAAASMQSLVSTILSVGPEGKRSSASRPPLGPT